MLHTTSSTRPRRLARMAALLAIPLLVGTLAACSGGDPKSSEKPAGQERTSQDWQVSFSACMRDEGIADYPDPEPDGSMKAGMALDDDAAAAQDAAAEACLTKLGEPPAGPSGELSAEEVKEQQLKTAKCLRDNGHEVEDPKEGQLMAIDSSIPQDVIEKCVGEGGGMSSSAN
ncbi:hypothetical protein [Plantibacter sp. YIM 135347]|uniref:hypothetical protein n=1 Tax=Plantibacter sp. YIM 135347 TaxID=3423919 RepID=UPI003D327A08